MVASKETHFMSDTTFTMLVFGAVFLVLLSASIFLQRPRFGGRSPKAIEVVLYRPFSSEIAYRTDITDRASCEKLLRELRQARFTFFGFKPTGVLNIQYDNGKVDHLKFTQCNDGTHSLTFHVFYEISSRQFCQALKEAGADVSKFDGNRS
jgi:hypothetical protein